MKPTIETISSRLAYQTPWMRVREDEIRYANGAPGLYSYIDKPDFALVIPYQDDGFWLVEQFRYTVQSREWEFPQGGWPAGQAGPTEQLAAAELREEVGVTAGRWTHLGRLFAAYGYSNQGYDVFLAEDLMHGEPDREDSEQDMRHQWFATADFARRLKAGEIRDGHTAAAWALFQLHER